MFKFFKKQYKFIFSKTIMNNVAVYFVNSKGFVMMLQDRHTRKWMTPGGMIENNETPFKGMIREFREETNCPFPLHNYTILKEWLWHNHTKVYLVLSTHKFSNVFRPTNETVRRKFFHYTELHYIHDLKRYVKHSMRDLKISSEINNILKKETLSCVFF
jgi:8-oxo-dGTP pyrophosphatase MutT (NUDIX family)